MMRVMLLLLLLLMMLLLLLLLRLFPLPNFLFRILHFCLLLWLVQLRLLLRWRLRLRLLLRLIFPPLRIKVHLLMKMAFEKKSSEDVRQSGKRKYTRNHGKKAMAQISAMETNTEQKEILRYFTSIRCISAASAHSWMDLTSAVCCCFFHNWSSCSVY